MMLVFTPSTLDRNRDRMLITISLETSMKKLVRLAAHTLRGSVRQSAFGLDSAVISVIFILNSTPEACTSIHASEGQSYGVIPIGNEC
jgi:hypothetical protein